VLTISRPDNMESSKCEHGSDTPVTTPATSPTLSKSETPEVPVAHGQSSGYGSMAEQLADEAEETLDTWMQALSAFLIYAGTW
jgi:hypothetical protein